MQQILMDDITRKGHTLVPLIMEWFGQHGEACGIPWNIQLWKSGSSPFWMERVEMVKSTEIFFFMHVWEREAGMPKLLYMWSLAWDSAHWKKSYSKDHATVRSKIRFCFGLPIIVLSLYTSWQLKRRLFIYTEPALKNGLGGGEPSTLLKAQRTILLIIYLSFTKNIQLLNTALHKLIFLNLFLEFILFPVFQKLTTFQGNAEKENVVSHWEERVLWYTKREWDQFCVNPIRDLLRKGRGFWLL